MRSEVCLYEQQAGCSTATAAGILTIMRLKSQTFSTKESGLGQADGTSSLNAQIEKA